MTYFLVVIAREQSDRGNLPGGWRSAEYMPRTFSVGYFAIAQYDVLFLVVIAREQSDRGNPFE